MDLFARVRAGAHVVGDWELQVQPRNGAPVGVSVTVAAVRSTETEERAHSKVLSDMTQPPTLQSRLDSMMKTEKWHVRGGGWIGQAIYGANDGLGSVFGIVSGVAGATAGGSAVLGLVADLSGHQSLARRAWPVALGAVSISPILLPSSGVWMMPFLPYAPMPERAATVFLDKKALI